MSYLSRPLKPGSAHGSGTKWKDVAKSHHSKKEYPQQAVAGGTSFYFVINELEPNPDYCNPQPLTGNQTPPENSNGYNQEAAGTVFRYFNGRIQPAQNFFWARSGGIGTPGYICYCGDELDENGNYIVTSLPPFQTCSVFDCWRFLPRIFCWEDPADSAEQPIWYFLHFEQNEFHPTVSNASHAGSRHTIGRNPPRLLPQSFHNTQPGAPRCGGLSGDLGIVLGLMALTRRRGHTDEIAQNWRGPGHPWTGNSIVDLPPHHTPRGVVVHVAVDPFNTDGSSVHILQRMGMNEILVTNP